MKNIQDNFAKVFQLAESQVLVVRENEESEEGDFHMTTTTVLEHAKIEMKRTFRDESLRDEAYNEFNYDSAESYREQACNAWNSLTNS